MGYLKGVLQFRAVVKAVNEKFCDKLSLIIIQIIICKATILNSVRTFSFLSRVIELTIEPLFIPAFES